MNGKVERVKRELRQLRRINHGIEVYLSIRERHEKRLAFLRSLERSLEVVAEIERLEQLVASMDTAKAIMEATRIEEKYMAIINTLEPVDRTIVLEGYISGVPYWKIGREIGYTERGIQKRAAAAIEAIARRVE